MSTRTVYSSALFRLQGMVDTSYSVLVPPGERWIIRDVDVYANNPILLAATFFLQEQPTDAAIVHLHWAVGEQSSKQWTGRQVIDYAGGDGGFTVIAEGGVQMDVSVSGYRLTLP